MHRPDEWNPSFEPLTRTASVNAVYGEAISANDKTIIPVARSATVSAAEGGGRIMSEDSPKGGRGRGGRRWGLRGADRRGGSVGHRDQIRRAA